MLMKLAVIDVNVWLVLMEPCVNITLMTVCPTLATTTHCAKTVSIITLVFVSQVSLRSYSYRDVAKSHLPA